MRLSSVHSPRAFLPNSARRFSPKFPSRPVLQFVGVEIVQVIEIVYRGAAARRHKYDTGCKYIPAVKPTGVPAGLAASVGITR